MSRVAGLALALVAAVACRGVDRRPVTTGTGEPIPVAVMSPGDAGATAAPGAAGGSALSAEGVTVDGASLGMPVRALAAKYPPPCDVDPIDKKTATLWFWAPGPCRDARELPLRTTLVVLTSREPNVRREDAPISLIVWAGGAFFDDKTSLRFKIGDGLERARAQLGEPTSRRPLDAARRSRSRGATGCTSSSPAAGSSRSRSGRWRERRSARASSRRRSTTTAGTPGSHDVTGLDLARFARDGFLVVPGFVDRDTCATLRQRATALVAAFEPSTISVFTTNEETRTSDAYFLESGGDIRFFFEEEALARDGSLRHDKRVSINKIGHALHALDPVFAPFSTSERIAAVVAALGLAEPALVQSMYIFKNPFIGGDVGCHQDATFLHTSPISVTGLWFALEDATVENGCMWALPGGHRGPLRRRFARAPGAASTVMHELDSAPLPPARPEAPWVPLEAEEGTMVLLHGLVPHWSSANRSPTSRHAYALHFVDDRCAWTPDNWLRRP